jgi:hypothetical protein
MRGCYSCSNRAESQHGQSEFRRLTSAANLRIVEVRFAGR